MAKSIKAAEGGSDHIGVCMLINVGQKQPGSELISHVTETLRQFLDQYLPEARVPPEIPAAFEAAGPSQTELAAVAREIYSTRRHLARLVGVDVHDTPALDMLLDLFIARKQSKSVSVSSLCIAASAPATTALRYICKLADEGLIVRSADPSDGRRIFVELTDEGASRLASALKWIADHPGRRH